MTVALHIECFFGYIWKDLFDKVRTNRTKLKSTGLIILTIFINVIKSFKMTLNQTIVKKAKNQRYRNTHTKKTPKDGELVL